MSTKRTLARYLSANRDGLLWKAEGLDEYQMRLPRTATGTSLLGLVRHCLSVEYGYLVTCMGRTSSLVLPVVDYGSDPNGDFVVAEGETTDGLLQLYRDVGAEVDRSIKEVALDAAARVPWWGDRGNTTFERLLIHVLAEVARHAGHADIIREEIDGRVGMRKSGSGMWKPRGGWEAHVARVQAAADVQRPAERRGGSAAAL